MLVLQLRLCSCRLSFPATLWCQGEWMPDVMTALQSPCSQPQFKPNYIPLPAWDIFPFYAHGPPLTGLSSGHNNITLEQSGVKSKSSLNVIFAMCSTASLELRVAAQLRLCAWGLSPSLTKVMLCLVLMFTLLDSNTDGISFCFQRHVYLD